MRKGYTNPLVIGTFIIGLGVTGFMFALPGMLGGHVEADVRGNTAFIPAKAMANHLDENFIEQAAEFNVYQVAYDYAEEGGTDKEHWKPRDGPGSGLSSGEKVPTKTEAKDYLEEELAQGYQEYLDSRDLDIRGRMEVPSFTFEVTNATSLFRGQVPSGSPPDYQLKQAGRNASFNYSVRADEPLSMTFQGGEGVRATVATTTYLAPYFHNKSRGNRYFYMFNVTQTLTMEKHFRKLIAGSVWNVSNRVSGVNEIWYGECDAGDDCPHGETPTSFKGWGSTQSRAENKEEVAVAGDLENRLDDYIDDTFMPGFRTSQDNEERYDALSVEIQEVKMEYFIDRGGVKVDSGDASSPPPDGKAWRVSKCDDTRECDSGDDECDTCDPHRPLPSCSTTSWDEDYSMGDDPWGDDIWRVLDELDRYKPYDEWDQWAEPGGDEWNEPVLFQQEGNKAQRVSSVLLPEHERVLGAVRRIDDDEPTCSLEDVDADVVQRTRSVWWVDHVKAETLVIIEVTDERFGIPTEDGWEPMVFEVEYYQEQEVDFNEAGEPQAGSWEWPESNAVDHDW